MSPPIWLAPHRPSAADPRLLDLWPRVGPNAIPRGASSPAWLATGADLHIPGWCGCTTEYIPVPTGDGWWQMVPIWDPGQTPNPLRRYEPAAPR